MSEEKERVLSASVTHDSKECGNEAEIKKIVICKDHWKTGIFKLRNNHL